MVILDVVDGHIRFVEVLDRDDVRDGVARVFATSHGSGRHVTKPSGR